MGQKVHPYGFRLGFNKTWRSRWYSDRDYAKLLHEDLKLRDTLKRRFSHAGVSKIETARALRNLPDLIVTAGGIGARMRDRGGISARMTVRRAQVAVPARQSPRGSAAPASLSVVE